MAPKRRQLSYQEVDRKTYSKDRLPAVFIEESLRDAGRLWASEQRPKVLLGDFTTPRRTPCDTWCTSAKCFVHTDCYNNAGKIFRFTGCYDDNYIFHLTVESAGACSGAVRTARAAPVHQADAVDVMQRQDVLAAAGDLLVAGKPPTPRAVAMRLGKDVAGTSIRRILRARRKALGKMTEEWRESAATFREYAHSCGEEELTFTHIQDPPVFQWVALLNGFVQRMVALIREQECEFCLTGDFTFRMEHMGYAYGLFSLLAFFTGDLFNKLIRAP